MDDEYKKELIKHLRTAMEEELEVYHLFCHKTESEYAVASWAKIKGLGRAVLDIERGRTDGLLPSPDDISHKYPQ